MKDFDNEWLGDFEDGWFDLGDGTEPAQFFKFL